MEGCIAAPHWDACETCQHLGDNGCDISNIDMTVYLGGWILCNNYIEIQQTKD